MALRKPIKVEVLEELHNRLADLCVRGAGVGYQRHEVFEAAFFFGLAATEAQITKAERDAERSRNAQHLHGAALGA